MPDRILLPQTLPVPKAAEKPMETAGRSAGPNLLPLLILIPLLLRGRSRDGIYSHEAGTQQQNKPGFGLPKVFKTNDFLDILGAIEPHFHGYRQEFVNALMGIMDVHSSIRSLRQNWGNHPQTAAVPGERPRPDPFSIARSLVPFMSDDIRNPAERYINVIGSARGLMQQWRTAGGLFPNAQSGGNTSPLMGLLGTLVPGSDRIAQAVNLYQAMHASRANEADTPGHDEGTLGAKDRDTRGSLTRLVELAKDMGGGRGSGPTAADFASLLSRLKTT
jgi:hypothetical protein